MDWKKKAFKILKSLSTPILVIDRNYLIVYANTAAGRSFCLSIDNLVGRKCFNTTHKFDRPCWQEGTGCPVKAAFELKEQTKIIHEHIYGGKTVFEEITASPIFDDKGELAFVVEELNDATELIQSKEISTHLKKDMKILQGLLPICAKCKKIRDEKGYWNQIESYISSHSEVQFSHGLCGECIKTLYGKEDWYKKRKNKTIPFKS